jgi:isocitrate/isopropylmalate dehydrogenase
MLEHLGHEAEAARLMRALEDVLRGGLRTRDIGGDARTTEIGDAVVARLAAGE